MIHKDIVPFVMRTAVLPFLIFPALVANSIVGVFHGCTLYLSVVDTRHTLQLVFQCNYHPIKPCQQCNSFLQCACLHLQFSLRSSLLTTMRQLALRMDGFVGHDQQNQVRLCMILVMLAYAEKIDSSDDRCGKCSNPNSNRMFQCCGQF